MLYKGDNVYKDCKQVKAYQIIIKQGQFTHNNKSLPN